MLLNQMKTIKDKVRALLERFPEVRDSDSHLVATFYYYEIGETAIKVMTGYDVLKELASGNLTNAESIRRVRQKLQEKHPELRGKSYVRRQDDGEKTTKEISDL